NCGLIPENLLESELFGYEAGAFTGADKRGKLGKIETANGGTLFFDEIGEMPLSLQVKLLEFLQDRTMVRVGGVKKIPIDVRVIAATNRDLKEMVNQGTSRGDLYYRLNVMPINLLPLKDRREDIMPLVNMFLKRFNSSYLSKKSFDQAAMEELMEYSWPGNVRELMHVVERAMITCEGDVIDTKVLSEILSGDSEFSGNIICTGLLPLKQAKAELEGILVRNAYEKCGSTYRAAEVLGVNQSTVARILKKQRSESDA
ncbi:MAG: sigma 54-interacting transcriptional regulator, partial [Bacillota bacterium]|nr:sigma 54-interacting transcriptional regulator [Bacillota bacterium]